MRRDFSIYRIRVIISQNIFGGVFMIKKFFGVLVAVLLLNVSICAAAELIIFHTNDMHARVQEADDNGKSIGLAEMAAAVKTVKAQNPATL